MKKLLVWWIICLLSTICFSEPKLDCEIKLAPNKKDKILIIEPNEEVKNIELLTPIDKNFYRKLSKTYIFYWPSSLPVWPSLFFNVNGKEIHYVPELNPLRSPDDSLPAFGVQRC